MHSSKPYDAVIIIGGGHNGLVCACYLAAAGREESFRMTSCDIVGWGDHEQGRYFMSPLTQKARRIL